MEVPKDVGITFGVFMSRGEKRISSIPFSFGGQHTELSTRCQSPIPRFPSPLPPFPAPATDKWEDEEDEDEEEEEEEEDGGCFVPIRPWSKVTGKGREEKFSCDGKHAKHFIFPPFPLLFSFRPQRRKREKQ